MKKIITIVLCAMLLASVAILGAGCDEKHVHEFAEKNVKDEYLYSDTYLEEKHFADNAEQGLLLIRERQRQVVFLGTTNATIL